MIIECVFCCSQTNLRTMALTHTILAICIFSYHVTSLIVEEPMDEKLFDCLEFETRGMNVTDFPSAGIMYTCIQQLMASTVSLRFHHNVTEEGMAWIQSLMQKHVVKRRHRRQSPGFLRRRQEIRRLPDDARWRLFNAINSLKQVNVNLKSFLIN